jgi:hypothetical protein
VSLADLERRDNEARPDSARGKRVRPLRISADAGRHPDCQARPDGDRGSRTGRHGAPRSGRLGKAAFSDTSVRTNPRIPMVREIVGLLEAAF